MEIALVPCLGRIFGRTVGTSHRCPTSGPGPFTWEKLDECHAISTFPCLVPWFATPRMTCSCSLPCRSLIHTGLLMKRPTSLVNRYVFLNGSRCIPLSSVALWPASPATPQHDKETVMAAAISIFLRKLKGKEEKI